MLGKAERRGTHVVEVGREPGADRDVWVQHSQFNSQLIEQLLASLTI